MKNWRMPFGFRFPSTKWGFADKTGFDLLMLVGTVAVPLALGVLGWRQAQVAADNQRHEIMANYFEHMKDLVLEGKLKETPTPEVSSLAIAATRSTFSQLDGPRRGQLLKYLYESDLITLRCPSNAAPANDAVLSNQIECKPILKLTKDDDLDLKGIHFERSPDFSSIDLENAELPEAKLPQIRLREARMKYANLAGAVLDRAVMSKVDLSFAILSGAQLTEARLTDATLNAANLQNANLECAFLRRANLSPGKSTGLTTKLSDLITNLSDANLSGSDLIRANLTNAKLHRVNLSKANLQDAILSKANLDGANLQSTVLEKEVYKSENAKKLAPECYLTDEKKISRDDLDNIELAGADLTFASLVKADLRQAKLKGANLANANLTKADLRGADLRTSSLQEAILKGAKYDDSTRLPEGFDAVGKGMRKVTEVAKNQSISQSEMSCSYIFDYCIPVVR